VRRTVAKTLGVAPEKVRFQLGDTELPEAPVSGGSRSAASVAPAVQAAGTAARLKLIGMAIGNAASPLFKAGKEDIEAADGWLYTRSDPSRRDPMAAIIARNGEEPVETGAKAEPGEEKKKYSMHSFGAVFAEVLVDADLGVIRVPRVVAAYDIGQALNRKTAHSQ
jgi:xanthine dehydrogenase YagR molybdenum-binding subunit